MQPAATAPIQIFTARGPGRPAENCIARAAIWIHAARIEAITSRFVEAGRNAIASNNATAIIDENIAVLRCPVDFIADIARPTFIESSVIFFPVALYFSWRGFRLSQRLPARALGGLTPL